MFAYDVYLNGKNIDTVFFSHSNSVDEVREGLINHDGYDPCIEVIERKKEKSTGVKRIHRGLDGKMKYF
jgi:hypothetical protein